jgi:hypothetical protein
VTDKADHSSLFDLGVEIDSSPWLDDAVACNGELEFHELNDETDESDDSAALGGTESDMFESYITTTYAG